MCSEEGFGILNVSMIAPNDKYIINIYGENDTTMGNRLPKDYWIHIACREASLLNQCVELGKPSS